MTELEQMLLELKKLKPEAAERYVRDKKETFAQRTGQRELFCPNHILEDYLFSYYNPERKRETCMIGFHKLYEALANKWEEKGNFTKAEDAYKEALEHNLADVEIYISFAKYYRNLAKWEEMKKIADAMYPFCYTRNDIAAYYRFLGCYYLEGYKPDMAEALYQYSNFFYETEMAREELVFLAAARKKEIKSASAEKLQKYLAENKIYVMPKQETLGILYQVAKKEWVADNKAYAKILFLYLYQLTADEEVKHYLQDEEIEREKNEPV